MEKLTKAAVSKFLQWTTTRYNDWLDYGSKKYNVDFVYHSLMEGTSRHGAIFQVQCASPVGENGNYKPGKHRSWRTKSYGRVYEINCTERTIKNLTDKTEIKFQ